jgi:hypothetical protein
MKGKTPWRWLVPILLLKNYCWINSCIFSTEQIIWSSNLMLMFNSSKYRQKVWVWQSGKPCYTKRDVTYSNFALFVHTWVQSNEKHFKYHSSTNAHFRSKNVKQPKFRFLLSSVFFIPLFNYLKTLFKLTNVIWEIFNKKINRTRLIKRVNDDNVMTHCK